ncbi:MAG: glutaredoxin 3 [Alphaproteobacteria bacterium]|nr:MAG: glutaredoxin 3 [Alphaproteobacteria bacterium]
MVPVVIYTRAYCSYCTWAKELLRRKGVTFDEIDVTGRQERRAEMIRRANGEITTPQIFIGSTHVGGCDELYALERAGRLDALLAA